MAYSPTGLNADPDFRTERARLAGRKSASAAGVITRLLRVLPEMTAEQLEVVRRALPPVPDRADDAR